MISELTSITCEYCGEKGFKERFEVIKDGSSDVWVVICHECFNVQFIKMLEETK